MLGFTALDVDIAVHRWGNIDFRRSSLSRQADVLPKNPIAAPREGFMMEMAWRYHPPFSSLHIEEQGLEDRGDSTPQHNSPKEEGENGKDFLWVRKPRHLQGLI